MATAAPPSLASSLEKTNGAKLSRLLIDGGTTVLRNIFDHYHPPLNLAADLRANYPQLNKLLRKKVLHKPQWNKLFPSGGAAPDSSTFDITLLFLLLTNICILSPPLSGWHTKPPPSDTSHEANLARIKFYRNELYGHVSSTGIDTLTFLTLWQEISVVLVSLGLDQAEIDRLQAEHCGEEDYIDALLEWAGSEEDIALQLKDMRQSQKKTEEAVEKMRLTQKEVYETLQDGTSKVDEVRETQTRTQEVVDELVKNQQQSHQILQDGKLKLDEVYQIAHLTHQTTKETHQEVCQSQTKTRQAVDEVRESIQEVKQEVENLNKRREVDQADELLKNLVKSEFKGDIEYHAQKFQEGTREWIFKSVENWLDDRSSPNRVMVISGNAGMGKTVISAVLALRMQEVGRLSGSHFCQHNNARYRNPRLMLQSLACHLSHSLPQYKQALVNQLSRNLGEDLNNMEVEELFALLFKEPLSTIDDPGRNILIVIDGLDESEYQGRNELLDVIGNHFCKLPVWIRLFVTTRPERNIAEALKHLNPFQLEQNHEENLKDIHILFEMQLSHKIGEEHKDTLLKELVRKSEGLFLYAFFLTDLIKNNVLLLTTEELESLLPLGISSVYLSYFRRLEKELHKVPKMEEEHVLRFLCALVASREPFPIEFAARILNPDGRSLTAQRRVNQAISCVSTLLPVREGRIHFFHKSIKDWLTDKSCYGQHDFTADEKEGHEILSSLCKSELDNIKQKGVQDTQFSNTERYALQHGVQHMLQLRTLDSRSKLYSEMEELQNQYVMDVGLIYAKLCVNSTTASEDLLSTQKQVNPALLANNSLLTCLLSLLRKHSYILRDYPHLFFQCLLNDGGPELSCRAARILESQFPDVPFMKYLDKVRGADQARFYCSDTVACFDVSPQKDYMVCECRDSTIHLWSLQTGNREWVRPSLKKREFHWGDPSGSAYRRIDYCLSLYRSVAFHPSGKEVLPGTLQHVYTLSGDWKDLHPDSKCTFSICAFAGDKDIILTDCHDEPKQIVLWNMENGEEISRIYWDKEISSFTISQDGSLIAFSVLNGDVFLVDPMIGSACIYHLTRFEKAVCGLMQIISDNNTLVCGLLLLSSEKGWGNSYHSVFTRKPKFYFLTPLKDVLLPHPHPYPTPIEPRNFVLWPSDRAILTEDDFMEQTSSLCWVNNLHSVIPFLHAGSYISLSEETVLIGSPSVSYVAMVNIGLLDDITDSASAGKPVGDVRNVVFSTEGDTIYSVTSRERFVQSSSYVLVTVLRMSSREILVKKVFSGSVSLFPTKEGMILFRDRKEAELWNFELSELIRPLIRLNENEFQDLFAISDELIGCRCRRFPALCSDESFDPVDNSLELDTTSTGLHDSAALDDSSQLDGSAALGASSQIDDSAELDTSLQIDDSAELDASLQIDDSAELDASSQIDDSAELDASSQLDDSSMLEDSVDSYTCALSALLISLDPVVLYVLDITSGEFILSVMTCLGDNEWILSISCNSQQQLLICSHQESVGPIEKTTISLRSHFFVIWKRTTEYFDSCCSEPHMMFSPSEELVVTWKILDAGFGLHILDSQTGETLHIFLKDQDDIVDCKFVDVESLVCCSGDNFLRLFNVGTGQLLSVIDIGERPFSLGTSLQEPLVAIGLSGDKLKFIQVHLPADTRGNKGQL